MSGEFLLVRCGEYIVVSFIFEDVFYEKVMIKGLRTKNLKESMCFGFHAFIKEKMKRFHQNIL